MSFEGSARLVRLPEKFLPVPRSLPEEWNDEFFETKPSRDCNEKPEHAEERNCRSFVRSLGKQEWRRL